MATLKYDPDVDFSDENLSQPLLAALVGEDKKVLDIGCATGYLAALLRERGCQVDGVEYDPVMAEQAAPHVDRLEVGDVQAMDLPALFGGHSYDAVVLGDVLEHLTDPLRVLRSALGLLKPGGFFAISLPNVAHGSVRLGLLKGRFRYTPTGLLDDTHLRFFTLESVLDLMTAAGLAVVELRRTTAELFSTEVEVFEGDFPVELVALVAAEPEATTYQFVFRAVPLAEADPRQVVAVEEAEVARLAEQSAALRQVEWHGTRTELPVVPSVRVGLWGSWGVDDLLEALLGRVVSAELERRLPGVLLRFAAPHAAGGGRTGLGEPIEDLGPFGPARSQRLAQGLDAVIVVGRVDSDRDVVTARYNRVTAVDDPTRHLLEPPSSLPVVWGPVSFDGGPTSGLTPGERPSAATHLLPDAGVLASRVLSLATAQRRIPYLQSAGWLGHSPRVVAVHLAGGTDVKPVLETLQPLLDKDGGLSVVTLELNTLDGDSGPANEVASALWLRALLCPVDAGVESAVSVLAVVDAVVSTSATARAVAASYGVPSMAPDTDGLARLTSLLSGKATPAGVDPQVRADQAALDVWFEQVAEHLRAAVAPVQERAVLSTTERYDAMERAHAAMRARTSAEVLRAADAQPVPEGVPGDLQPEIDRLHAELVAVMNTRTMRVLKPARKAYSRLRARTR